MAEQATEKKDSGAAAKTLIKMIIGIVLIILGLWAVIAWRENLWIVFSGCIGLFLIMACAITFAIAKE